MNDEDFDFELPKGMPLEDVGHEDDMPFFMNTMPDDISGNTVRVGVCVCDGAAPTLSSVRCITDNRRRWPLSKRSCTTTRRKTSH